MNEKAIVTSKAGKWGTVSKSQYSFGKEQIPFIYDGIRLNDDGSAAVKLGGEWGFCNSKGTLEVGCRYDDVSKPVEGRFLVVDDGKMGMVVKGDQVLVAPKYDQLTHFKEGIALASINNGWGLLRTDGTEIIPPEFEEIQIGENSYIQTSMSGKWGLFNMKGKRILNERYNKLTPCKDRYVIAEMDGEIGVLSEDDQVIVPFGNYDNIELPLHGKSVVSKNGKKGMINEKGEKFPLFEIENTTGFDWLIPFARVCVDDQWGLINLSGEWVVPPRFGSLEADSEDTISISGYNRGHFTITMKELLVGNISWDDYDILPDKYNFDEFRIVSNVRKGAKGLKGLQNSNGDLIVPFKYNLFTPRYEGASSRKKLVRIDTYLNGKYGFLDKDGTVIFEPAYSEIEFPARRGYAETKLNGQLGLIHTSGRELLKPEWDELLKERDYILVREGDFWGIYNEGKDVLVKPRFVGITFEGGKVPIGRDYDGKYVLITSEGTAHGVAYDKIKKTGFNSTYLVFEENGKKGLIERNGKIIHEAEFNFIDSADEDVSFFKVGRNGLYGYMDKTGKIIIQTKHPGLGLYDKKSTLLPVKNGKNKWGYMNIDGGIIIPHKYDSARRFTRGYAAVQKGKKWGYINVGGDVTLKIKYDAVTDFKYGAKCRKKTTWYEVSADGKLKRL